MQLLDRCRAFVSISPGSHLACHLRKAQAAGKQLEMGVAIGVDERLVMAGAVSAGYGSDEYRIAGGLVGAAISLFPGKTIAVETPSDSEILLEGSIDPNKTGLEGPFLDYAGIPKSNPSAPVFEVTYLRHKRNPIFRGAAIGYEGAEDHILYALLATAGSLDFHGSPIRQRIQNFLLKRGMFRQFQFVGALRQKLKGNQIWKAGLE
jgi:UbiD family decarboxylase